VNKDHIVNAINVYGEYLLQYHGSAWCGIFHVFIDVLVRAKYVDKCFVCEIIFTAIFLFKIKCAKIPYAFSSWFFLHLFKILGVLI